MIRLAHSVLAGTVPRGLGKKQNFPESNGSVVTARSASSRQSSVAGSRSETRLI